MQKDRIKGLLAKANIEQALELLAQSQLPPNSQQQLAHIQKEFQAIQNREYSSTYSVVQRLDDTEGVVRAILELIDAAPNTNPLVPGKKENPIKRILWIVGLVILIPSAGMYVYQKFQSKPQMEAVSASDQKEAMGNESADTRSDKNLPQSPASPKPKPMAQKEGDHLEVYYTRLFGASQVIDFLEGGVYTHGDFNEARKNWIDRDAQLVYTEPWEDLQEVEDWEGDDLLNYIANRQDPFMRKVLSCYYFFSDIEWDPDHPYDEGFCEPIDQFTPFSTREFLDDVVKAGMAKNYSFRQLFSRFQKNLNSVGFLLLTLKNASTDTLENISVDYVKYEQRISDFRFPQADTVATVLAQGSDIQSNKLVINLAPKDKVILLLAIYLKNTKGYPASYISTVLEPRNLSYETDLRYTLSIRKPLKDKAAKIRVPWGWSYQ